jgi:hypothetical protein
MIDFFDLVYARIKDKNQLLKRMGYYSLLRFIVRYTANKVLPLYFLVTKNKRRYSLSTLSAKNGRTIVSLTSFPNRIKEVWLVIETILRQTIKPDQIVLWLSKEQFPSPDKLPSQLLEQQKRGLKIVLKDGDLRSHKKYFYTLQEFPNDRMITLDDDIFYPTKMIEELFKWHEVYPDAVIARYGTKILKMDNLISRYRLWDEKFNNDSPSFEFFFGSGGGTLFPPKILAKETINKDVFMNLCPTADDVWLNTMCRINNKKVFLTRNELCSILPIIRKKDVSLAAVNYQGNQNDIQLKNVRKYYLLNNSFDPYRQ